MVVVEMHEECGQKEAFLAAVAAGARLDGVEAIEEPIEIARGSLAAGLGRQGIHGFVGGAQSARGALARVVLAEGLIGPALGAVADKRRQLMLVVMLTRVVRRFHGSLLKQLLSRV